MTLPSVDPKPTVPEPQAVLRAVRGFQASVQAFCAGCPHLMDGLCTQLTKLLDAEDRGKPRPCHTKIQAPCT